LAATDWIPAFAGMTGERKAAIRARRRFARGGEIRRKSRPRVWVETARRLNIAPR